LDPSSSEQVVTMPFMPSTRTRIALTSALALFALAVGTLTAPAFAQDYPTPPNYPTPPPDGDAGPDEGAGEAPEEEDAAPEDDAAAPDTGAGAPDTGPPVDDTQPLPAGTLPVTGSDDVAFMTVLGLVMLLGGVAVRRGLRGARP